MVERLVGFSELSMLGDNVRGIKLIKAIGSDEYGKLVNLLHNHLKQTVDTTKTFGAIIPTLGLYMENFYTEGGAVHPSMLVMHVPQMTEEEISKHLPQIESSTRKYGGRYIFISAEATITIAQKQEDGEIDQYEVDGIKTTIYHPLGVLDLISEITVGENDTASLERPMIIEGKGEFDHLFDHILSGTVVQ